MIRAVRIISLEFDPQLHLDYRDTSYNEGIKLLVFFTEDYTMSYETGGRADKLGNRYEGRWLAIQLLRLLEEEIRYIVVEPIGDDERGVEFFIELKSNVRQFHQCKARNASEENWSVNNLKTRGVIQNILYQLDRQKSNFEFVFVSGVPVTSLGDICDSARTSPDDAEQFYIHQIKDSGPRTKIFKDFCKAANLDSEDQQDRKLAYNYLKRIYMKLFPGDLDHLLTTSRYLLSGDPEVAVSVMLHYIESHDKFGKPIYANELIAYLNEKNIYLKDLGRDKRIFPAIEVLQRQFSESIEPHLIRGQFLEREEITTCINALNENGLVLIHGDAGKGKSGILYGITEKLKELQIPFIPIRVDRQIPKDSAQRYGEYIGLPDSPALCIAALAVERPAVLVIDQLDAIRWTSSHSSNALEVCKELIRQVKNARRDNKDVRIIMSCRTFDLNYDPEIRHWLSEKDKNNEEIWKKIDLQQISQELIQNVSGDKYTELSQKQQGLLSNIQNLFMWVQLIDSGHNPLFESTVELLEIFWKEKLRQIERSGVSSSDVNQILDRLSLNMENRSENSSSHNTVSGCSPKALEMLQSHGIIQEDSARISFCHQSYLDYLIARKTLNELQKGKSIVDWLGPIDKQTLFRREQLRQILSFLSQERILEFVKTVRFLLFSDYVRFHLKQLVLEIWSSIKDISAPLRAFTLELLENEYWNPYMIETVFFNNAIYTKILFDKEYLQKWISSSDENLVKQALELIRSVVEKLPDETAILLDQFLESDKKWTERIYQTLGWNLSKDSDNLFSLRMKLADKGYYPYVIDWKDICDSYPSRALQMIEVCLSRKDDFNQISRIEKWHHHDMESLLPMVEKYPQETWDKLMPHIISKASTLDIYELMRWNTNHEYDVISGSVELLIRAGKTLALHQPIFILEQIQRIPNQSSPLLKYMIANIYTAIPVNYSDNIITWLLEDLSRLQNGEELGEPAYKLTTELVAVFTQFCSEKLFSEFEKVLLHYCGDEVDRRKFYIRHREGKYYNHRWGLTQYKLLSKLCQQRISEETAELLAVLKRKFNMINSDEFERSSRFTMARYVGSTLDKNLYKISDRSWLAIVKNTKIQYDRTGSFKESEDGESYIESSIWQFSRSLERAANSEPEHFANLLLSFPDDVNTRYVSAIFRVFERTTPESTLPEEFKDLWKPVPLQTMLQCIEKFYTMNDREEAIAFCRLLKERAEDKWPDKAIDKLVELASRHPDLEPGKLNVYSSGWDGDMSNVSIDDLSTNTYNSVRGVAAHAIGNLLWEHPQLLPKFESSLDSLVNDPHPVIRMAAIYPLLPVINIDKGLAVRWFLQIPQGDFRTIASHYGVKFISYMIRSHYMELKPIIQAMLGSTNEEVSKKGAEIVAGSFFFYDLFEDEIERCCSHIGSIPQKKGVALTASHYIGDKEVSGRCRQLLMRLIGSDGKELSKEISDIFRHNVLSVHENTVLYKRYLESDAYDENSLFMYELKNYEGSLLEYADIIFSLFNMFAARSHSDRSSSSRLNFAIDDAIKLLLRLYDQSKEVDEVIFRKCLDTWDLLFQKRIVYAKRIINELN